MIKILSTKDNNFEDEFNIILNRADIDMDSILPEVLQTLQDIKKRGEDALLELVCKYDNWEPKSLNDLKIDPDDAKNAYNKLDSKLKDSLQIAHDRIYAFHESTISKGFIQYDELGNLLGQGVRALNRAGIYIPGGKAFYPSSLLMNALPAKVAGVKEIIMTTPTPNNHINELLLAAMHLCNIQEAYKIGGVGAIGMLAYGIGKKRWSSNKNSADSIIFKKVDVITGPGNIYVASAKKLVFGEVNIDMIAGPSEIGIIADKHANADFIAIDMLSQAEHDEMASSILITDSKELATKVANIIDHKLQTLQRSSIAKSSIDNRGAIIITQNLDEAISLMNEIAPEHLEILTANPFALLPYIESAGAIFLGEYTPEAIGDYLAGPNHTLPTGGSARFFSPLSAMNFCTKNSIISFSKNGLHTLSTHCMNIADIESLQAHKLSIKERLK